jgi:hypothetical protein
MSIPSLNAESLDDYIVSGGDEIELAHGVVVEAKQKPANERQPVRKEFLIKKTPKSDPLAEQGYKNEFAAYLLCHHSALAVAVSFFEDDDFYYVVYEKPPGKHLVGKYGSQPITQMGNRQTLILQFFRFLLWLKTRTIFYLRATGDNIWVNEFGGKHTLTILGLDTCASPVDPTHSKSISRIYQHDNEITIGSEFLALGVFIHKVFTGEDDPFEPDSLTWKKPAELTDFCVGPLLEKLFAEKVDRDLFNPLSAVELRRSINFKVTSTSIAVERFKIDWSDGIIITSGDVKAGFTPDRGLFMNSGQCKLVMYPGEGVFMEDRDAQKELRVGSSEVYITYQGRKLTLNDEGLTMGGGTRGSAKLGAEGFSYIDGPGKLLIGEKIDASGWSLKDMKQNIKPPNVTIGIKEAQISFGPSGLELDVKGMGFQIGPDGLAIKNGPSEVRIAAQADAGLKIALSAASVELNATGLHLALGDVTISITGGNLKIEAEGFTISVGTDGFNFSSESEPFTLLDVLGSVLPPEITAPFNDFCKLKAPPLPSLPKLNLMSLLPSLPDSLSLPSLDSLDLPEVPGLSDLGIPGVPGLSDLGLPKTPSLGDLGLPKKPSLSDLGVPKVPGMPSVGDVARGRLPTVGALGRPSLPGISGVPKVNMASVARGGIATAASMGNIGKIASLGLMAGMGAVAMAQRKKAPGHLEDHLEEGEEVVEGPVDIKRRSKLFGKKIVKMVKTSTGRFLVMSGNYSEIRQVYEFGPKARVSPDKNDILKFVDAKGKAYPMIFTTAADRDKWKGLFEEAIAAAQ